MGTGFRLNADERRCLTENGFVIRERVFNPDECIQIGRDAEDLVDDLESAERSSKHKFGSYMFEALPDLGTVVKWEPDAPDVVQGAEPFAHISEPLHRWALDPRFLDPCKDLVGEDDIELFTEKLNVKRARTGGPIVLHQDYPYWMNMTPCADRIVSALLYIDDADMNNGCLEVVPGSHKDGKRSGKSEAGFGANEIKESDFKEEQLVPVEAPAGSVVYFGGFLVHRSLPNKSDKDRRVLIYSYQPKGFAHALELNSMISKGRSRPILQSAV